MSGTAFGTVILHASPECAIGGPLGLVRSGDRIRRQRQGATRRRAGAENELQSRISDRRARYPAAATPACTRESVLGAEHGCDFDFLRKTIGPVERTLLACADGVRDV